MSSDIGVISCSSLIQFKQLLNYNLSFSELLNYIAKKGIQKGLLCYSNPNLLKSNHPKINKDTISNIQLFRFIKSNYKYRWVWLYQINQLVYHKKLFIFSLFSSFFYKKINISVKLPKIEFSKDRSKENLTIDVLIPTLGREKHLKQVLLDLSNQTLMPTRIIIIEQQAVENSSSTLDFLEENWPFEIDHTLIYQLGVCNARNLALNKVSSDWVFFADDDIRLNSDFLESSFKYIKKYKAKAVTLSCLQKNEIEKLDEVIQWSTFGTNATIVKSEYIKDIVFDMALEFGYGEDFDFGMLLRNSGVDVLYIPFVKMLHLKAPTGGFRKKIKKDWETEVIQPKPSPTVMVSKLKHATKEQLRSYKTNLFIKFYRNQAIKNPFRYFRVMRIAWNRSKFWANVLLKNNSDEI
jgi:glycosyltransferase involved in cell wall biosynthesis